MDTQLWSKLSTEFTDKVFYEKIKKIISDHFSTEYEYLVGHFSNANQAKSAKSGVLVKNSEVIDYLQKKGNKE